VPFHLKVIDFTYVFRKSLPMAAGSVQ